MIQAAVRCGSGPSLTINESVQSHDRADHSPHRAGRRRERDRLIEQLQKAGRLEDVETIDAFHKVREGRNGGGDPWYTDGDLRIG